MFSEKSLLSSEIKIISDLIDKEFEIIFNLSHLANNDYLGQAIKYSLSVSGKRLRPFLLVTIAKLFGVDINRSLPIACAIELIHNYSLIHDDLPAMDNDDYRRFMPTCHKKFDEATAILVGDALLTEAFRVIADEKHTDPVAKCKLISLISKSAGALGMVGGQMLDLRIYNFEPSLDNIKKMQEMKTGALIKASCLSALMLAGIEEENQSHIYNVISKYADNIGLAFQIKDDILDVEASAEEIGKKANKDKDAGKITFIDILGVDNAKKELDRFISESIGLLNSINYKKECQKEMDVLKELTYSIRDRKK